MVRSGAKMGKRGAVRFKSGQPVDHSGPGLSRARNLSDARPKPEGLPSSSQPKSGPIGAAKRPCCGAKRSSSFTCRDANK
jgi:hypothetical protein